MAAERDQLFLDLFTTALEGGIGYWSVCAAYHWHSDESDGQDADLQGFYADIHDVEEYEVSGNQAERQRIDRAVVARGYGLATGEWRNKVAWSTEAPPLVITADTDWDFDAGDADVIVQLGLFGEVVYG